MKLTESKKLTDLLVEQGGEMEETEPNRSAIAHRGFNSEGEDTSEYLELGMRLGAAACKLHQGQVFYADVGYLRFYVVATSEDQACKMVRLS